MQRKPSDNFAIVAVVVFLAAYYLVQNIFDNLFYAWIMRRLAELFNVQEAQVYARFSSIVVPLSFLILLSIVSWRLFWRYVHRELSKNDTAAAPPIKITFDQANPNGKFWSIQPMRDETGKQRTFWEYRALIKNVSAKTLRNVKVIVEAIGPIPMRPEPSQFDINKKELIDLNPQEETLVVVWRWFNPPIRAGMASGTDIYGPVKLTASADDVSPTERFFHFDPERTPMIWEKAS